MGLCRQADMSKQENVKSWIGTTAMLAAVVGSIAATSWQYFGDSLESPSIPTADAPGDFMLDEVKQKYIWDLEHFTFEIEHRVFPKFKAGLRERDPAKLLAMMRDDFSASTALHDPDVISRSGITSLSRKANDVDTAVVDAPQFVAFLIDRLHDFREIKNIGLRVLNISAADRDPATGIWTLRVLLTATGTAHDGLAVSVEQLGTAECEFLDDHDLADGRIFTSWDVLSETVTASPVFLEEVTSAYGLDQLGLHDNWSPEATSARQYTAQVTCGDWNLDGRHDLAIATLTGEALLLAGTQAGGFENVTEAVGIPPVFSVHNRHSCAASFDFDNDGDDDLLLGPHLYRNRAGKSFERMEATGLRLAYNPMGCVFADYDCDGLLDIYVLYQHFHQKRLTRTIGWVGDDTTGAPNQLWRNLGDGRFADVTEVAGVAGGLRHTFAATWLHANDDHYPDLYVANDFAKNSFFINQGDGTFVDHGELSGTSDFATSMGVASADIDGDGSTEIYVANMYSKMGRRIIAQVSESDYPPGVYEQLKGSCAGNRLYRKSGDGPRYEEISDQLGVNAVGWAYAPTFIDFDLDGYQDIYATAGFLSFRRDKPDG